MHIDFKNNDMESETDDYLQINAPDADINTAAEEDDDNKKGSLESVIVDDIYGSTQTTGLESTIRKEFQMFNDRNTMETFGFIGMIMPAVALTPNINSVSGP